MRPANHLAGVLAAFFCLTASAVEPDQWQGQPLRALLNDLNESGLQVIFSTALVDDELLIVEEPDLSDPVAGLLSVLRPLGLELAGGPSGSWLVVRGEAAPASESVVTVVSTEAPLPEIIVTSSLHRLEYAQANARTYLDRELASRLPTAAEEAVRMTARLPGTAGGGISVRNHIRGGEANEVLFLLDGLRLYEPYHMKNFQSVATIINSNAIEGIDFYSGAYPARYGDRMSGVMNMHIRQPEKAVETELALSFFNASVLSMGRFGDGERGDWLFSARRGNLDLIADIINPELGNPEYQDYILHTGWEFGPRAVVSANILASKDELTLADPDRGEQANANYTNQVFWLRWDAEWSSTLRSETIFSASDISDERSGTLALPGIVSGTLNESQEFRSLGIKQDWTYSPSSKWMLLFGVEGKRLDSDYRFVSTKLVTPPFDDILDNEALLLRNLSLDPGGAQYGAHIEVRWQLHENLIIDAGIRRDYQSYTTASDDSQTSPRLSVLYRVAENTEFRLGWGQYSQAQEINELQVSDGLDTFFPAQRAEHFVANFSHHFERDIDIELSIYRKIFRSVRPRFENVFNTLTLLPEIQFDRYRIDASSADARGAELQIKRGGSDEALLWWLSYGWSEVTDKILDGDVPRAWDQTHALKAGISWRWGAWNIGAAGEYHSGWPKTELVGETVVDQGGMEQLQLTTTPRNSQRFSSFQTIDLRLSRVFNVRHGDLTAFMEVSNLLDRANPCCIEYSVTSEPASAPMLIANQKDWLPLVPSLGIVWRF
jgi:outer membrane receptor protein involved in Fe transport